MVIPKVTQGIQDRDPLLSGEHAREVVLVPNAVARGGNIRRPAGAGLLFPRFMEDRWQMDLSPRSQTFSTIVMLLSLFLHSYPGTASKVERHRIFSVDHVEGAEDSVHGVDRLVNI